MGHHGGWSAPLVGEEAQAVDLAGPAGQRDAMLDRLFARLPPPLQGAAFMAMLAGITAVLSGGLPALFDWTWWATAATAALFGAGIGWWSARPPPPTYR